MKQILGWDDFFASVASLSAMRSKDPHKQTGACIVNDDNRLVGIGYNGMPRGIEDGALPWSEAADDPIDSKHFYVCHATMNAVLNKNQQNLKDCRIYCTHIPCNECAKILAQVGIRRVLYVNAAPVDCLATQASQKICAQVGISLTHLEISTEEVYLPLTP